MKITKTKQKIQWTTQKRMVKDLIPYKDNPNEMTENQMDDLKKSMAHSGYVEIIAVDFDGEIIAGHQRHRALMEMGRADELIDVRVPSRKLTKKEFQRYLIASNAIGGYWNDKLKLFDMELLMDIGVDLEAIWDQTLEVENDNWDEEKELEKIKKTDIKPGDMFSLGRHRLICGDALDRENVAKLMGDVKADMINDDLPFNIGLSYDKGVGNKSHYGGTTNDKKSDQEYRLFVKTIMENALSVTKPDAHVFFWCDERYVWLFQELYKELGINSKRLCIWIKDNASPTPQIAFNKVTEFCVYGAKGRPYLSDSVKNLNEVMNKEVSSGNRLVDDILDLLNIWLVKRLAGNKYDHPTQKPPTLHEKALRRCTRPGDAVLDLTAGSGSILSACHQLKRTAYLCEKEPLFCQLIINLFKKISNDNIKKIN